MKRSLILALFSLMLLASLRPAMAQTNQAGPVYIIPIKGMIERALVYVVRRGVNQAVRDGASAIILDMDTPGGRLDACEEIMHLLSDLDATTYTFVNPNAISAGAIIALSTDQIYMAPSGRIGDAMPVMMSPIPMGGTQEIPEGLKEKALSPTVALIRSAAQRKGHDANLAEAMVRPEYEYSIGDEVICPAGQLLTLTSLDAERLVGDDEHPLLSRGTVKDMDALLELIGHAGATPIRIESSSAESIARMIDGFPLSGILLAAGLLGLYIEYKTPGFGLPGLAGIALLAVWFWGHQVAGLAGMGEVLLFLVGTVLLFVEIFLIPGFGITGMAGLGCILLSLILAMVQHYPGEPWYQPASVNPDQIERMILNLGGGLFLTFLGGVLMGRFLPATHLFQRLMLTRAVSAAEGYQASTPTDELMGLSGTAETPLRPAGIGSFGSKRLNVVTQGVFIDRGEAIVIAETHGSRIVVRHAIAPAPEDDNRSNAQGQP
ncbi:MAG: nodulation protein NfeD [Lentisphaerae bacterium]|nr:nodulation protein NfeD [Lentisphaerota bacterium]